ncbi:MAG: bifunctional phosphoribosylaminoimidazolecarboxamide formyltransferase/IMP cyclohydrolase [Firmicutes bacterium]|nr:bifunctional phosphoribosylaminoimidazolecarboxamide formyltransferase/IMP cyclohydrolase [Bacillota bacterium]
MMRALVSVSNKRGIAEFAQRLAEHGVTFISTGGTHRTLVEAGVSALDVSAVTGFPEMMDGRVKTLHPAIHGGLLALRDNPEHMRVAAAHGIEMIDMVVVNLYPFAETVARPGVALSEAIEQIDIGGPSMLRSAAKNWASVIVVVDPGDYGWIADRIAAGQEITRDERLRLAAKVFRHTARYDAMIAGYLTDAAGEDWPETYTVSFEKAQDLRYGENPHQQAAFYVGSREPGRTLAGAQQVQGKELSYNNIQDAAAALAALAEFDQPAVVAVKHVSPCGVGVGDHLSEAWRRAYDADPISIFGGIVAVNRELDQDVAEQLAELFLEIVIAPSCTESARALLSKKKNLRVLVDPRPPASRRELRTVGDGLLVQDRNLPEKGALALKTVTKVAPTPQQLEVLEFAWRVVKHVRSNAIVMAQPGMTVGIGGGQTNRVGAVEIAARQAAERARGAVLASDAYFPMPDNVEVAARAGVSAIIQPGGSIRDADAIAAADAAGIAMVFTGHRHFKH